MKPSEILIIPNTTKNIPSDTVTKIADQLCSRGADAGVLPEHAFLADTCPGLRVFSEDELVKCRAAVVLGGDGSIIDAAQRLLDYDIPILGINFGHLGYLAQINADEIDNIAFNPESEPVIEKRLMLDVYINSKDGTKRKCATALNDAVITNGPVSRLISFDIFIGDVRIQTCRADGLIVATPTGSTAYSLSAGGPVLDPAIEAVGIVPICPHTLSSRPVILRSDSVIRISNIRNNGAAVYLNTDGREVFALETGDSVEICESPKKTGLIKLRPDSFLEILSRKLGGSD